MSVSLHFLGVHSFVKVKLRMRKCSWMAVTGNSAAPCCRDGHKPRVSKRWLTYFHSGTCSLQSSDTVCHHLHDNCLHFIHSTIYKALWHTLADLALPTEPCRVVDNVPLAHFTGEEIEALLFKVTEVTRAETRTLLSEKHFYRSFQYIVCLILYVILTHKSITWS